MGDSLHWKHEKTNIAKIPDVDICGCQQGRMAGVFPDYGHFHKSNLRRHTVLLIKNYSLHIKHMPRHNFCEHSLCELPA
jgi:hypothetical protein